KKKKEVEDDALNLANERLVTLLAPGKKVKKPASNNPFEMLMNQSKPEEVEEVDDTVRTKRKDIKSQLENGQLENEKVTIEVTEQGNQLGMMMPGMDNNGMGDMLQKLMPKRNHNSKKNKLNIKR